MERPGKRKAVFFKKPDAEGEIDINHGIIRLKRLNL
jgi:hypothetical protein